MRFNKTYFILFLILFVIEVFIATKMNEYKFIREFLGDVIVVGLVYCFVLSFLNIGKLKAAIASFGFACFIEFLQYCKIVDLLDIQNKILRIAIGTTFTWSDIFAYFIGTLFIIILEFGFRKLIRIS